MDFIKSVEEGIRGLNKGLPNSFNRFNTYLNGTQKGVYYAVAGLSGTGKTAISDANFVLEPYFQLLDAGLPIDIRWIYHSFEISKKAKTAKWVAYRIYHKYGVLTDANEILSRGNSKITPEIKKLVDAVWPEIQQLFRHIKFIDEPQTPNQMWREYVTYAETRGSFTLEKFIDANGIENFRRSGYIPKYPDITTILMVDHIGLAKKEKGLNKKDNIDKLSSFLVYFRNMCEFTPVVISQFNRGLTGVERMKFRASDLSPGMEDFKDSGGVPEDCNVALGIMDAHKLQLEDYLGYDITKLQQNFRAINIMKNRDGISDVNIGVQFIGQTGRIVELPLASYFEAGLHDYNNYRT